MAKDPNELGALWIKQSARGEYLSGLINGEPVVAFRNDNKKNDKQPDWRVLKSKPREGSTPNADPDVSRRTKPASVPGPAFEEDGAEIPF